MKDILKIVGIIYIAIAIAVTFFLDLTSGCGLIVTKDQLLDSNNSNYPSSKLVSGLLWPYYTYNYLYKFNSSIAVNSEFNKIPNSCDDYSNDLYRFELCQCAITFEKPIEVVETIYGIYSIKSIYEKCQLPLSSKGKEVLSSYSNLKKKYREVELIYSYFENMVPLDAYGKGDACNQLKQDPSTKDFIRKFFL